MGRRVFGISTEFGHLEVDQPDLYVIRMVLFENTGDNGMQKSGFTGTGSTADEGGEIAVFKIEGQNIAVFVNTIGNISDTANAFFPGLFKGKAHAIFIAVAVIGGFLTGGQCTDIRRERL